ncbi:PepSY domain-containing protein [Staphylococcus simulans]|nr:MULTISPECIES: PepSY domain-containing protein [Staphylococcus]KXA45894.1 putative peptidase propeptide and YPEB domain protein [Staphylococcus simulans]MDQ7113364.1 PepSY domain-containing protein [Staphylococcus simulans]MDQ7117352.1 PepSY domain-containing protein [Staphylococcus simulans]MDU0419272.1 PepSY domain-containing protein [Staphylococcus simulans]MDU0466388.1 PepSY domain-containing protein [Staphylococcus simulans]
MQKKMLSLLVASGIVLAACGQGGSSDENKNDSEQKANTEQKQKGDTSGTSETGKNSNVIKLGDIKTQPEDAVKTAKKEYDGELKEISFEKEQGKWAYKIDLQKQGEEGEVIINSKDGKVMNKSTEKEDDYDKAKSFKYEDFKPYDEIIKKAKDNFNGDIHEWSLSRDSDEGKFVYDVDLQKGNSKQEFSLDAKTAKILKNEKDD